ncbi:Pyridoxal phosphate homeostasis protein [Rubripirellula tenax]|uniref:Pyridoxal phosphate homeostasis protein n=1 Tax=Rubripirellula tenax TaxID=2528015 RepID=A0A5C6ELV9_9BACT|nr:YggS family pyridoxal phosphate-dependent enzyme [Rubripirellula tenax]TWU48591.1 Pyridoxal phosphate homeostasis protein [Rubripirellula tenax]
MDSNAVDRLAENWNTVAGEVRDAAAKAGRDADDITVIGVTKYVDASVTAMLVDAGCKHLGENRPQVLWQKAESLAFDDDVRWHVIGHLQRNKARRTLRHRPIIHSVDSPRLLATIAEESAAEDFVTDVLLEVNASDEEAKTGMSPDEIRSLLETIPQSGVRVVGIMAMAGWGTDSDAAQRQFAATRHFRDQLSTQFGLPLPHLSMGMSGDFVEAIAEGATMVRIGSRLYEGVIKIGH